MDKKSPFSISRNGNLGTMASEEHHNQIFGISRGTTIKVIMGRIRMIDQRFA
jgi:hypothetical protein